MIVKCHLVHKQFERGCWSWCQLSGKVVVVVHHLGYCFARYCGFVGEGQPLVIASLTSERSESELLPLLRSVSPISSSFSNQEVGTLGGTSRRRSRALTCAFRVDPWLFSFLGLLAERGSASRHVLWWVCVACWLGVVVVRSEMQGGCASKASSVSQRTMEGSRPAIYERICAYFICRGKARIDGLYQSISMPYAPPILIQSLYIFRARRVEWSHNHTPSDLFLRLKVPERSRQPSSKQRRLHHPTSHVATSK